MKLRGGKLKRHIGIDIESWEYVMITCKVDDIISIAADIVGEGNFNLYIVEPENIIEAPVKGRLSGFNRDRAIWHQEGIQSIVTKYKTREPGDFYIFFDNHHDAIKQKYVDIDIKIERESD